VQDRVNNVLPKLGEPALLMALSPVIILPISYFVFKEKSVGRRLSGQRLQSQELQFYSLHNHDKESSFNSNKLSVR